MAKSAKSLVYHLVYLAVMVACSILSISAAEVEPGESVYSLYDFADDFKDDPLATAKDHPQEYAAYILEHPEAVAASPAAYEAVVSTDVAYINQNKQAFISYLTTRGIAFQGIDGHIASFTVADGRIQTAQSDFTIANVHALAAYGASDFRISEHGELTYQTVSLEPEHIALRGTLTEIGDAILLTDGAFIRAGDPPIIIMGKNSAKLLTSSQLEITVVDNPIQLPQGTLFSGSARFFTTGIALYPFAEYENYKGTRMSASEELYIFHTETNFCKGVSSSCINDNPLGKKDPASKLVVFARAGANIKIITSDELYNAIVVPTISVPESTLDLTIIKKGGSEANILFTTRGPLTRGKLHGITTTIANTYARLDSVKIYAWLLHQGNLVTQVEEQLVTKKIKIDGSLDELMPLFIEKKRNLLPLLLESIDLKSQESSERTLFFLSPVLGKFSKEELALLFSRTSLEPIEKLKILADIQKYIQSDSIREFQKEVMPSVVIADKFSYPDSKTDLADLFFTFRDNEDIQLELLQRASGIEGRYSKIQQRIDPHLSYDIVSLLLHAGSDRMRKLIFDTVDIKTVVNYEPSALMYLREVKRIGNQDLRFYAMKQFDFSEGIFITSENKGRFVREILTSFADAPDQMRALLEKMPRQPNIDFNPQGFGMIYSNPLFQERTKDLDFANKYSVALTAQRYLNRRGIWSENAQSEVINAVMEQRQQFEQQVILGKDTYYIPITHEEEVFNNAEMVGLARDAGVRNIADETMKGDGAKTKFLDFVRASGDKGKTTIHFQNHGGPDHQWLSSGQAGSERSDNMRRPNAISYVELGDALAARGKLGEVKLLVDSCYSKDFTNNLYGHLNKNGVKDMPTVVTETNRGEVGYQSVFIKALQKVHTPGTPLTGADIFKSESETFIEQDLSVTLPMQKQVPSVPSIVPGVVDMGSTDDDGAALPPKKQQGILVDAEKPTAPLPPTLIEISRNEQERDTMLAAMS